MGDSSDNIPGVPGIGAKTAAKLLQRFGSMQGIYDNLDQLKGKQLENLRDNRDAALLSRRIATIVTDLDFPLDLEGAAFPDFDPEAVSDAFGKYALSSSLSRVLKLVGAEAVRPAVALSVDPVCEGERGVELVKRGIADGEMIGVSFIEPDQASLFDPGVTGAFNTSRGTALLAGDEALRLFCARRLGGRVRRARCEGGRPPRLPPRFERGRPDRRRGSVFHEMLRRGACRLRLELVGVVVLLRRAVRGASRRGVSRGRVERGGRLRPGGVRAQAGRASREGTRRRRQRRGVREDRPALVAVLASMERTGAAIDAKSLASLGAGAQQELDELSSRIYELAGRSSTSTLPSSSRASCSRLSASRRRRRRSEGTPPTRAC